MGVTVQICVEVSTVTLVSIKEMYSLDHSDVVGWKLCKTCCSRSSPAFQIARISSMYLHRSMVCIVGVVSHGIREYHPRSPGRSL